ncbi:YbfB/YjiJ family MFS transporter [Lacibacterium aquatile]|uniref:YbfB/YjiJ family MFS transporter n=1 Tax=Lacibacterium aquatile TaxID=1168082 RepID=A0ABW5DY67_9PROT
MNESPRKALVAAALLGLAGAVALGFARFAYALLVPAMQADLDLSYAAIGGLNGANAAGYLLGALSAGPLANRFGLTRVFIAGALGTAATVALTALGGGLASLLLLRLLPGVTGAWCFVAGGVLTARLAAGLGAKGGLAIGLFYAGPGVGILLGGLAIPELLSFGWRTAWVGLGLLALVAACGAALGTRTKVEAQAPAKGGAQRPVSLSFSLAAYACFAMGYIGYMTFIIAALRRSGLSADMTTGFWCLLGIATMLAAWPWAKALQNSRNGRPLAAALALTSLGAALPLAGLSPVPLVASAILFGGSFLAVVAATTAIVRAMRPAEDWPRWVSHFTVVFGVGQVVGPVLTGTLGDIFGSTDVVLATSAAILGIGVLLALCQPSAEAG